VKTPPFPACSPPQESQQSAPVPPVELGTLLEIARDRPGDVNKLLPTGQSPLQAAAALGSKEAIGALIRAGAERDIMPQKGQSPL
jgi:hypothetical protein